MRGMPDVYMSIAIVTGYSGKYMFNDTDEYTPFQYRSDIKKYDLSLRR